MAAFTLIELIITIVVIMILATIGVRFINFRDVINLNAQAQVLVADIRYTQNLSITQGIRYCLTITSSTTYKISDINGNHVTNWSLGSGITFGTLTNLPNSLIAFDSQGTPYSNNTLPGTSLTANATIPLNASDGTTQTVTITQSTGEVSS